MTSLADSHITAIVKLCTFTTLYHLVPLMVLSLSLSDFRNGWSLSQSIQPLEQHSVLQSQLQVLKVAITINPYYSNCSHAILPFTSTVHEVLYT